MKNILPTIALMGATGLSAGVASAQDKFNSDLNLTFNPQASSEQYEPINNWDINDTGNVKLYFNNPYNDNESNHFSKKDFLKSTVSYAVGYAAAHAIGEKSERAGDILQFALPLSALYMEYKKGDKEGMKRIMSVAFKNIVYTNTMKYITKNNKLGKRPSGSDAGGLPSGHGGMANVGGFEIYNSDNGGLVGMGSMSLAGLTGGSRVVSKNHTPLQVGVAYGLQYLNHTNNLDTMKLSVENKGSIEEGSDWTIMVNYTIDTDKLKGFWF